VGGRSCPYLHYPPSSCPTDLAQAGLKLFTSVCASPRKPVASGHIRPSPALPQVRFTPQGPQLRTLAAIPSHKSVSLPQLAKPRHDKSKTNPRLPHILTKSNYSLVRLCNLQFHSSSKVVCKNINPRVFTALFSFPVNTQDLLQNCKQGGIEFWNGILHTAKGEGKEDDVSFVG